MQKSVKKRKSDETKESCKIPSPIDQNSYEYESKKKSDKGICICTYIDYGSYAGICIFLIYI